MKTVFKSNELPHTWAHQQAEVGRNSCGNMSFDKERYFSYGTCIGEIVTIKGTEIYLVDKHSYSVTTSGHQSCMCRAIPYAAIQLPVENTRGGRYLGPCNMNLKSVNFWARNLFKSYLKKAENALVSSYNRRLNHTRDRDLAEVAYWLKEATRLKIIAKLRLKVPVGTEEMATAAKRTAKRAVAYRKAEAKRRTVQQLEQAKKLKEALVSWVAGQNVYLPWDCKSPILFRVRKEDDGVKRIIETSHGANAPYEDGKKAFRFAIARRTKGWRPNGETFKLGEYVIQSISELGVIVGCHHMKWPQITAFAKAQGWVKD